MKKSKIITLLVTFAVLTTILFTTCDKPVPETTGHISGTITEEGTNEPVEGVEVLLSPGGITKKTGGNGAYSFDEQVPQKYAVTASKEGYITEPKEITVIIGETVTLNISLTPEAGELKVTAPSSSTTWNVGESETITWQPDNIEDNVKLELFKGSSLIKTIVQSTSNDGEYPWVLPTSLVDGSDYSIKVTGTSNSDISDQSDDFTITSHYITIISPTGTSNFTAGSQHNILWDGNVDENVKIEFFKGDVFLSTISETTPSDGSFPWLVSSSLLTGNNYKIRISGTENTTLFAESDKFSIEELNITVTAPSGGAWLKGQQYSIEWNDNFANRAGTKLELYKGGSFQQTVSSAASGNNYLWLVPTELSTGSDYTIKAISIENSSYTDYSEAFTITDAPVPTATTLDANSITETTSTLNGTVNANGSSTNVSFEYGTTTSYGSTISPTINTISGTSNTSINASLDNLVPGQSYHFRAVGTNEFGTSYGNDKVFTTIAITPPTATTQNANQIGETTATLNALINANNNSTTVIFEYGTTSSYGNTVTATQSPVSGTSNKAVSADVTGLTSGQVYHFRVKAENAGGIVNGNDMAFTTIAISPPTVSAQAAGSVTDVSATINGIVNANDNNTTVIFEYGTTTNYGSTINATPYDVTGTVNTSVSANITNLTAGQTYHFRLKAENAGGTSLSNDIQFTASDNTTTPVIVSSDAINISYTSATLGGDVTNNGGANITERGVCWSTSSNPTTAGTHSVASSAGTGAFIVESSGLSAGMTYYTRAYATNSMGTSYGNNLTFTTLNTSIASVSTTDASNITYTTATLGGNVTTDGGTNVTERGVCWGTMENPSVSGSLTAASTSGTGSFSVEATSLTPGTVYFIRAYAQNSMGISYGANSYFTSQANTLPVITTVPVTDISQNTATSGGNITDDGGQPITERGICWSTNENPTLTDSYTTDGTGLGVFVSNITGLTENLSYYVRAYAVNSVGISYGVNIPFSSIVNTVPAVTTSVLTNVTCFSALAGGEIIDAGGLNITQKGICWGTNPNPTVADNISPMGSGEDAFSNEVTDFAWTTTYYVRAYAVNSLGLSYGNQQTFTTLDATYHVGDFHGGGIVFHVNPDGLHGKVIALSDLPGSGTFAEMSAVVSNYTYGSYSDWSFPSTPDWEEIGSNISLLSDALTENGGSQFSGICYWTAQGYCSFGGLSGVWITDDSPAIGRASRNF